MQRKGVKKKESIYLVNKRFDPIPFKNERRIFFLPETPATNDETRIMSLERLLWFRLVGLGLSGIKNLPLFRFKLSLGQQSRVFQRTKQA